MRRSQMRDDATLVLGVVLYRNSDDELRRLTRSIEANQRSRRGPAISVTWLDNSPDRALEQIVAALGPGSGYRFSGRNLGFGAGHNRLMARAFKDPSVSAYVCVNPDAVLHPDCCAELWAEMNAHPRTGLVEAMQFPDEHPKVYDPTTHATPWCSGAVLLVTRDLYAALGGFDEGFFMYCEDVDLSWRARAAGFFTAMAPKALAAHYTGDRKVTPGRSAMMFKSGVYLGLKYGSQAFARKCYHEYLGLAGDPFPLPKVERPSAAMRKVADLNHMFHCAEVRWS